MTIDQRKYRNRIAFKQKRGFQGNKLIRLRMKFKHLLSFHRHNPESEYPD